MVLPLRPVGFELISAQEGIVMNEGHAGDDARNSAFKLAIPNSEKSHEEAPISARKKGLDRH